MTFIIPEFIQYFFSQMHTQLGFFLHASNTQVEKNPQQYYSKLTKRSPSFKYRSMQGYEMEMVMGKLGIFCDSKAEDFPKRVSSDDLFNLFEQEQPRLDEVKEAFDVFDDNKDGYIDASELKRVFSALGWMDKVDMDDCNKMIRVFDDNNDGRIDFDEFVKFMEGTFC